jgi:hypothetical protein
VQLRSVVDGRRHILHSFQEANVNDFYRQFLRAWGRGLGYQAARRTGWVLVPLLIVITVIILGVQLFEWDSIFGWTLPRILVSPSLLR